MKQDSPRPLNKANAQQNPVPAAGEPGYWPYDPNAPTALENPPDATALAHLVAQSRFGRMSNQEAISAALRLLHECQTALKNDRFYWCSLEKIFAEYDGIPQPPQFPASFDDFCRLIVHAKDEAENTRRVRHYVNNCAERMTGAFFVSNPEKWADDHFAELRQKGFINRADWYLATIGYRAWWKEKCAEDKRRGGRERVRKFRRAK
jgi:hypothetical protein